MRHHTHLKISLPCIKCFQGVTWPPPMTYTFSMLSCCEFWDRCSIADSKLECINAPCSVACLSQLCVERILVRSHQIWWIVWTSETMSWALDILSSTKYLEQGQMSGANWRTWDQMQYWIQSQNTTSTIPCCSMHSIMPRVSVARCASRPVVVITCSVACAVCQRSMQEWLGDIFLAKFYLSYLLGIQIHQ